MRTVGRALVVILAIVMVLIGALLLFVGGALVASPDAGDLGNLAGVGVAIFLIGLLLVVTGALLWRRRLRADEGHSAGEVRARMRYVSGGERPAVAQARLDQAAKAVADRAYAKAFSPMYDESYEADRRGDPEALKELLGLASEIESAPDVHQRTREDAREMADRLRDTIQRYGDVEVALSTSDGEINGESR